MLQLNDRRQGLVRLLVLSAMLAPGLAFAEFPDKPLKLIVPYSPGGTADVLGRTYAEALKERVGQPVIVENKPGATGAIGTAALIKAPADGYTFVLNSSSLVINPWLVKQSFDAMDDLTPVARTGETAYVVYVSAKNPIKNLEEFKAYTKAHPGEMACSSYGNGSPTHIALELFKKSAGVKILHVPYKTFAQALPDLLSGQLGCSFDLPTTAYPYVKSGQLRAIATTGAVTMSLYPDAEPIGKQYPEATVIGWQAVFARSGTPEAVLTKVREEWAKAMASPEVQKRLVDAGFQPSKVSIDDFKKEITSDYEKYGRIIKEVGIKLQ